MRSDRMFIVKIITHQSEKNVKIQTKLKKMIIVPLKNLKSIHLFAMIYISQINFIKNENIETTNN